MALPEDRRQTEEQVVAFAKKAVQQNEFHRSRRDPDQRFRRDPYQKVMGWLLPRAGKSGSGGIGALRLWSTLATRSVSLPVVGRKAQVF